MISNANVFLFWWPNMTNCENLAQNFQKETVIAKWSKFVWLKHSNSRSKSCTVSFAAVIRIIESCCCLQTFYTEKFGPGLVEIVKDSNPVEHNKLDPNKVRKCHWWIYMMTLPVGNFVMIYDMCYGSVGTTVAAPTAIQAWQTCPLWELSPSHPILV